MNESPDLPYRHDVLTEHQAAVARSYLEKRAGERHHLVIYLSGAHAYGFPSPDSDLDLKSVHIAPTSDLVGLVPRPGGAEVMVVQDGVEIDYGSNELGGSPEDGLVSLLRQRRHARSRNDFERLGRPGARRTPAHEHGPLDFRPPEIDTERERVGHVGGQPTTPKPPVLPEQSSAQR